MAVVVCSEISNFVILIYAAVRIYCVSFSFCFLLCLCVFFLCLVILPLVISLQILNYWFHINMNYIQEKVNTRTTEQHTHIHATKYSNRHFFIRIRNESNNVGRQL